MGKMPTFDEADLLATRREFPGLSKGVHLVSHSLGAMPAVARTMAARLLDEWETESVAAWGDHWLPAVRSLGDLIAGVLGVPPGSVCVLPNVSIAQAIVASCFTFEGNRRRVVYDELNFSTVHYVWQAQARRGAQVVVVPAPDGIHPPLEPLLATIDERTLIVPISHVLFRSSGMYDAKRVIDHAHAMGAMVLLDVYQSAATVPLRLADLGLRLRLRRLGQVGVRRPRSRVSVRAPRSGCNAGADGTRMVFTRGAVRVRHGADAVDRRGMACRRRDDADSLDLCGPWRMGDRCARPRLSATVWFARQSPFLYDR